MKNINEKAKRFARLFSNSKAEYFFLRTALTITLTIDNIIFIPLFKLHDKIFGKNN